MIYIFIQNKNEKNILNKKYNNKKLKKNKN